MTGPEHYRKAEELAAQAKQSAQVGNPEHAAGLAAVAQVHATLALASAVNGLGVEDWPLHVTGG